MCGRYTLTQVPEDVIIIQPDGKEIVMTPRYNIAPSQYAAVIPQEDPDHLHLFKWGLIPQWAKNARIGYKMINARSETVLNKSAFSEPVKSNRCLVLADGFYEWRKSGKQKQAFFIRLKGGKPFHFAGICAEWAHPDTGEITRSFSILTCPPNSLMEEIHDRMPVILNAFQAEAWLSAETDPEEAVAMLKPWPTEEMEAYPVSAAVGNVRNDYPELIDRVAIAEQGKLDF